jgi:hypothetical protein
MTTDSVPAGVDPRRLLSDVRTLAHRVRLDQRVTWLPLLVLALVTLGAIPVYRYGHRVLSDCRPVGGDGQVCKVWFQDLQFYWLAALVLAYMVIAGGYLRVAQARGLGARVLPYALTGVALVTLGAAFAAVWVHLLDSPGYPDPPPVPVQFLFHLLDPTGAIGLALLVLAWLERHVALLLFALGYLAVVLVPIGYGWMGGWGFAPQMAINGGLLLLGSAGFALAQRLRRPR